jgi:hypothetical protein
VPYERLKQLYGLTGSRPGRHQAHQLGNLTYISEGLNGIRTGVGSRALKLDDEPAENRAAHLIDDGDLRTAFRNSCLAPGGAEPQRVETRGAFEHFCSARGRLIADDLIQWEADLRTAASARSRVAYSSAPRLVVPGPEDLVRAAGYAEPVTEALLGLLHVGFRCQNVPAKDTVLSMHCTRDSRMLARIDLFGGAATIRLKLMAKMLDADADSRLAPFEVRRNQRAARFAIPTATPAEVVTAAGALAWLQETLQPTAH